MNFDMNFEMHLHDAASLSGSPRIAHKWEPDHTIFSRTALGSGNSKGDEISKEKYARNGRNSEFLAY